MFQQAVKAEFRTEAHYQAYRPDPDLRSLIHEFWIMHLDNEATHQKGELELPRLYPELIFKFGEDYEESIVSRNQKIIRSSSIISGISTYAKASKRVNVHHPLLLIGIKFKPAGFYELLHIPIIEFLDQCVNLADLNNSSLINLEDKLASTATRVEILEILNRHFLQLYSTSRTSITHKDLAEKIEFCNLEQLNHLIQNKRYNYKYLERFFKKHIGASPKKYFKLRRFTSFYQDWLQQDAYRYIDLVYKHNYYDQNHLIKEFKSVMNMSPGKFLKSSPSLFTQHITRSHL